jgi:hypothetical protein
MTSLSMTAMGSSPVRSRIAIWMKAMVRGAPRRAAEAATRTAPAGTNRSRLQRTTLLSSKTRPTPQPPILTYVTKSSHQASPAVTHQAPDKAPNRHARTARALSTPPSFTRLPSASSNPTAASRSRMLQSERLTMYVSTGSTSRTTSNHRQGGSHL